MLDQLARDIRFALRTLRRTPAFTLTAVATLALVIGGSTAVMSIADALLVQPLPYPEPARLAAVVTHTQSPRGQGTSTSQDGFVWEAVRDHVPALDAAVYSDFSGGGGVNLVVGQQAMAVSQERVSSGYFRVLGVQPAIGREFTADEDRRGGPDAAILSDAIWRRLFNADQHIVGQAIRLKGQPMTVVGVMPASFQNLSEADVWTPLRPNTDGEGGGTNYGMIARVRQNATWADAEGQLRAIGQPDLFKARGYRDDTSASLGLMPLQEATVGDEREPIVMLLAAVGTVLLIACVNLAALLLARGGARAKEIATRMALGSGRGAVVRQLMVEAIVLAIAGGVLGMGVGALGLMGLKAVAGTTFSDWTRVTLDARVLTATFALSLLTAMVFGLVPAWQASRLDVQAALSEGGSRSIAGGSRHWSRRALVVAEVALGVVLLVGAGLLLRTFLNLRQLDPGFNPEHLTTASVSLQDARYQTSASVVQLVDQTLERLRARPGVEAASVSLGLPYQRLLNMGARFSDDAPDSGFPTNVSYASPGFFETLGMKVRRGRALLDTDRADTAPILVVNETFARVFSKGRDPIGRRLRLSGVEREIVGVVGDVQQAGSGFFVTGMTRGPITGTPQVYLPVSQTNDGFIRTVHTWFVPVWTVRDRSVQDGAAAIQEAIAAVDPLLPVSQTRDMTTVIAASMRQQRLLLSLVGVIAAAALLLAAIGIHGLIAHAVSERRREFGIRIALGASAWRTTGSVAISGLLLAGIGAVVGGLLSVLGVQLVSSFLWGVGDHDPATYVGVALFLFVVAGVASVIPALRILKLDPAVTLRS